LFDVVGREVRRTPLKLMSMRATLPVGGLVDHLAAVAPRQELAIALDVVDEVEHLLRAVRDEDGAVDGLHVVKCSEAGLLHMSIVENRKRFTIIL
jgi:hypothetical protein